MSYLEIIIPHKYSISSLSLQTLVFFKCNRYLTYIYLNNTLTHTQKTI